MERIEGADSADNIVESPGRGEVENSNQLTQSGRKLISLIVKVIVNAVVRECNEKSDKISEIQ